MINLILADSNELIRIGLRTIFKGGNVQILGEAESNEELLSQIKTFSPSIVLIDYTSKGFSIDVIPAALNLNSKIKTCVAVSTMLSARPFELCTSLLM